MEPTSSPTARSFTRRRVLAWGGAGAIGGIAAYAGWPERDGVTVQRPESKSSPASQASAPATDVAGGTRREDFLPHLKSAFQLDSGSRCTLVEVSAAEETASATARFTSFSLLFAAPPDSPVESRIHQLVHAEMGALELFISPVGRSRDHVYLEAVCSQRV